MKTELLSLTVMLWLLVSCGNSARRSDGPPHGNAVAPNPPMGWNSFDAYDCRINEKEFKETVDYMADHLLQYGWNYAVIDYIWWHPSPGDWKNPRKRYGHPNIRYATNGKPLDTTYIDNYGRLIPAPERFPSSTGGKGFKPVADYVHSKGLKFGIHIMRGIHRYAYFNDMPVMRTNSSAREIAEINDTCNWCNHMFGVDPGKSGSQEYYDSLFELYAEWGVDFVKVDDILYPQYQEGEIEMIRKAIDKCGRPMVLSLSPGEAPLEMGQHLQQNANMWRISADFWDEWEKLKHNFDLLDAWSDYIGNGSWPDADMLPIGKISLDNRPHGPERWSKFTQPELYTLLTLWMISRSPLMLGADLLTLPDSILKMITNEEVIKVNQNSSGNRQIFRRDGKAAWLADDPESDGKYLALFNLSDSLQNVEIDFKSESLNSRVAVRDLWKNRDLGLYENAISISLEPHGAGLYRLNCK